MSAELGIVYQYFDSLRDCDYDTWFDKLPPHWEVKKISHVVKMQSGDSIESSDIDPEGDFPVYGGNGFRGYAKNYNLSGHYALIGRQGALCGNVNFSKGKVWVTEHAIVVYPFTEVDVKWLGETLRAMDLNQYNVSAAQPGLSISNLMFLRLPFPPYIEQQKIANFLDHETAKIDTLIEKQQQLVKLLKEKRQAVISHAVTKGLNPDAPMKDSGVEWLGEVPEGWVVAGFKMYLNRIVDYRGKTPQKEDSGVFLVTARNIKNGSINYEVSKEYISERDYESVMSRGKPKLGELLFTTEAPLGEVATIDQDDIALAQRIIKLSGLGGVLNNEYLKFYIMSAQFQTSLSMYASGSTALGIKAQRLTYLRQLVPPESEQLQIVEKIEKNNIGVDALIERALCAIKLSRERRTALISAAVTGKIDVRNWQPPADTLTPSMDA